MSVISTPDHQNDVRRLHSSSDNDEQTNYSPTSEMTMDEVVEAIGFGTFHWKLLFLCGVGYFAEITELVVVSFVAPSIQREMDLTNAEYGLLGSSSFIGMAAGALFWGYVSDHMGRQLSFALTVWLTFFGGFLSALAPNYFLLLFLRFVAAFGIGGMLPVDYTVFLEFLPAHKRGAYIVLVDTVGIVPALTLSATIAWYFAGDQHVKWRWVLLISSIPVGIMGVLRRHVPESPRYHLAAGETLEAQRVIQDVADCNQVRLPDEWRLLPDHPFRGSCHQECSMDNTDVSNRQVTTSLASPGTPTSSPRHPTGSQYSAIPSQQPYTDHELTASHEALSPLEVNGHSVRSNEGQDGNVTNGDGNDGASGLVRTDALATTTSHSLGELVRDPHLAGTTYRLWACYFCVQLSSAGMVFALPKLFDQTFQGRSESEIALDLLIGVVGLIPGLAIAFVAVEVSRTRTLAAFFVCAGLSTVLLGYSFLEERHRGSALFMSIVLRGSMEGCFAVLNTTAVESYPTLLRASGLGTAQIFDHIAGAFSPVLFSVLNGSETTRPWVFVLYAISYFIATFPALGLKDHAGDVHIDNP